MRFREWMGRNEDSGWFPSVVEKGEKTKVLGILTKYFQLLEAGQENQAMPDQSYRWQWYDEDVDVGRLRKHVEGLDSYLVGQMGWVQQKREASVEDGPGLARLPDAALLAMYQELDALHYEIHNAKPNAGQREVELSGDAVTTLDAAAAFGGEHG